MLWKGRRQSANVSDRRGGRGGIAAVGGGTLILALIYALLGGDPSAVLETSTTPVSGPGIDDEQKEFVSVVLADTEDVWNKIFRERGERYSEPTLVLFERGVDSACGRASAAVGPFYCPADEQLYLDLSFFRQLSDELGASGDFARAYVVAHEVGHHVQNLLGLMPKGRDSVEVELQADCLAGVWAKRTQEAKKILESGDLEEAMGAAAAVGDDRLQQRAQGYVVPDSFTHGSAAQRVAAFRRGFDGGDLPACGSHGIVH